MHSDDVCLVAVIEHAVVVVSAGWRYSNGVSRVSHSRCRGTVPGGSPARCFVHVTNDLHDDNDVVDHVSQGPLEQEEEEVVVGARTTKKERYLN